jgi:hypothetical protein
MGVFDGLAGIFTDTFGEPVTYALQAGGASALSAIFRAPCEEHLDKPGTVSAVPRLYCNRLDLPAGARAGDTVSLRGATYAVRAMLDDEIGVMVELQLEKVG